MSTASLDNIATTAPQKRRGSGGAAYEVNSLFTPPPTTCSSPAGTDVLLRRVSFANAPKFDADIVCEVNSPLFTAPPTTCSSPAGTDVLLRRVSFANAPKFDADIVCEVNSPLFTAPPTTCSSPAGTDVLLRRVSFANAPKFDADILTDKCATLPVVVEAPAQPVCRHLQLDDIAARASSEKAEIKPSTSTPKASVSTVSRVADAAYAAEGVAVEWWHRHGCAFFPGKMTGSVKGFVSCVFWHSFLITLHTPISRAVTGEWMLEAALPFLYNELWQLLTGVDPAWIPPVTYKGAAQDPQTDRTFGAHAFFGLLWLFASYLQMVVVPAKYHRRFGYFTLAILAGHLSCCFNILGLDQQKHKTINKQVLLTVAIISIAYFVEGMRVMLSKKARVLLGDGWKFAHQDAMVNGFIWSVSGAGPIRQVATIQVLFGAGPTFCQAADGGKSTHCLWPYAQRLLLVALWNSVISGAYCLHRKDAALTRQFLRNTACGAVCLALTACLARIPGTGDLFDSILGKELTGKSTASVLVLSGLYCVYLSTAMGQRWMFGIQLAVLAVTLMAVTVMPLVAGAMF